ncbi:hypothetical protein FACS1894216_13780 [Synergistales bacterium]|nr:hypothetical protein FACS1894216_13780 [Synergistales bacterium]
MGNKSAVSAAKPSRTFHFFVDSISNGAASLIPDGGDPFAAPLSSLPAGVREGDWLSASFAIDARKRAEERDAIDKLFGELGDNP